MAQVEHAALQHNVMGSSADEVIHHQAPQDFLLSDLAQTSQLSTT